LDLTNWQAPDHAVVKLNEISAYLSGRLLSASEAAWRLLGLKLHNEQPPVIRLDVHLPYHQQMIFDPTADARDILEAAEHSSSTLLEWFALNSRDPLARRFKYADIPEHFVWKNNTWFPRERAGRVAVGRIFGVSPGNAELFALRSLLDCVTGAMQHNRAVASISFSRSRRRPVICRFGLRRRPHLRHVPSSLRSLGSVSR
jgi:hypothetical protein